MEAWLILQKGLNEARWQFEAGKHQSDYEALGRGTNSHHMLAVAQR